MQFITFSGVDGSGKSTQLALLREKLEREGKKVAYFHAVEFALASQLSKSREQGTENKNADTGKSITNASWISIVLRKIQLIIDLIRFRFYFSKLRSEDYDYLLSDRYFFDTIINIEYLESKSGEQGAGSIQKKSVPLFSVPCLLFPDTAFFFDANPEIIMRRDRAPEQGVNYLRAKQALFRQKLTEWNMVTINANRDKELIFQDIISKL